MVVRTLLVVLALSATGLTADHVLSVDGKTAVFAPQAQAGYVVKQSERTGGVGILASTLFLEGGHVRRIGGRSGRGMWIVESDNSQNDNGQTIRELTKSGSVAYAAPLFSLNGQTVAIIPEIVLRLKDKEDSETLQQLCSTLDLAIIRRMEFTELEYLIEVPKPDADSVFEAVELLNKTPLVEWAYPNGAYLSKRSEPDAQQMQHHTVQEESAGEQQNYGLIPNDEYFPMQWHLHNTGQFGGAPGADINAPEAWEIATGDPNIIVVVHDSGVDLDHPDLVNGLVQGYDFFEDDMYPYPAFDDPGEAHGTQCAGVIVAQGNNSIGTAGVAWGCKVMPIRDGSGNSYITWEAEAYVVRLSAVAGADILNNSWLVEQSIPIFHSAIVDVTRLGGLGRDGKGCVVLFSAGNSGTEMSPLSTAAYPEVIAVGATDNRDVRWSYSAYGPQLDIVAPGGERWHRAANGKEPPLEGNSIWTTDISGAPGMNSIPKSPFPDILDYSPFTGTSSACPVAAGVAALILSLEPELTNVGVRHFLERSAKDLGDPGRDDYYGWGRVDARAALDMVLAKRSDLNNDWRVDSRDFALLAQHWRQSHSSADIAPATDRDGYVGLEDVALMCRYWQYEIPEP